MKATTVRKDIIPYRAGVVKITPLDANKQPDRGRSVATEYDFLTSTQTSVSYATEELENGNGQNKTYVNSETYTVTVTGNTYNPVFHAVVTGRLETLPDKTLMPDEFSVNLPAEAEDGTLTIAFGEGTEHEKVPATDEKGNYNFVVEDSYGNVLTKMDKPEYGAYSYDADSKALQFSEEYANALIRVIYYYEETNAIKYASNPILQQPEYLVEIFGLSQSASTGETYKVYTKILRATASGDVADQTTQKSRSAPITYTFTSTPVPDGMSAYEQVLAPVSSGTSGSGGTSNIVNGLDDKFTTAPVEGGGGSGGEEEET